MKVTVIEMFQDSMTGKYHKTGDQIEISDAKRVDKLVDMKLVEVIESSPKPKKTTSKK